MKGIIVKDWSKVNIADPAQRKLVMGAVQHFFNAPCSPEVKAGFQAFATSGDFPATVLPLLRQYQLLDSYDMGYEQIFDIIDMTSSDRNGFELSEVEDGLAFAKVTEGAKAKIYKMSGTKQTITFDMYGAGLGWSRRLFDDKEYWTVEKNAIAFRNRWYKDMATNYYALIEAVAASQNITWQAVTPANLANTDANYNAIRDRNTINKAAETILLALRDSAISVTPQSEFIILAPIQLIGRIKRAMGLLNSGISGNLGGLNYNVRPIYTMMLNSATSYYVILPKQKIVGGNRMNLTVFDQFDPTSYSDIAVGWGRYGGAIGEVKQIQRCAIA